MLKLIRANQKKFLAGLTILSMITFLVSYKGTPGDHGATERVYGTVAGQPIKTSEVAEARAELSALKTNLDFSTQPTDEQGRLQDPKAELMHELISAMGTKPDWYLLLRHEANTAGVQVSEDDVKTILTNYTQNLQVDSDPYLATEAGITGLLKIIARYDQVVGMLKISKPEFDRALVEDAENIQLDLLQLKAADYLSKIPPPTTQQLQDQFTQFAAVVPHQPNPTTNPFGFGYRLPLRAKLQYIWLTPDAVNAATTATKSAYDWEVQARKYYLAHLDEFPTTAPASTAPATATASVPPLGPLPFKAVQDKILSEIRGPQNTALTDQVQRLIVSTLNTDWQAYSQYVASGKPAPEPASSLGVPYTSFDYLSKLADKVQSKFNVKITVNQTPEPLAQEQIATLAGVGTPTLAETAIGQVSDYLKLIDKKDPTAAAQRTRPSPPMPGSIDNSVAIYRLSQALPSEPPPALQVVQTQVETDIRTAAAYKLAEQRANDIVTNIKDRPLFIAASAQNPMIHVDHLSMQSYEVPEIQPPLGDSLRSFTTQAFGLLSSYNPTQNRNPAEVIALPEQGRLFPAQLSFVNADWTGQDFFIRSLQVRAQALRGEQNLLKGAWFQYEEVLKRTDFKSASKNSGA